MMRNCYIHSGTPIPHQEHIRNGIRGIAGTMALIIAISALLPALASATVIGTVGHTYPFAEPDALTEVVERARQVDWKRVLSAAKEQARHHRPEIPAIPRADVARKRQVAMSFTLDVDVPDPRDPTKIKYPKGFVFNPLAQFTMPACILFVNAADRAQREWLMSAQQARDPLTPILLTGGDFEKIERALKRPVHHADALLLERFGIKAVPAIACQKGATLEVEEIDVRKNR